MAAYLAACLQTLTDGSQLLYQCMASHTAGDSSIDVLTPRLAYECFCRWLYLPVSVCLFVTLLLQIDILLFCFSMESSHFLTVSSPCGTLKTLFGDFWFRPPNAQNLLPKICTKSTINRLLWHTDRRCFRLLGGFRGRPIQWNHAKCCAADPCCHGNDIWLGADI